MGRHLSRPPVLQSIKRKGRPTPRTTKEERIGAKGMKRSVTGSEDTVREWVHKLGEVVFYKCLKIFWRKIRGNEQAANRRIEKRGPAKKKRQQCRWRRLRNHWSIENEILKTHTRVFVLPQTRGIRELVKGLEIEWTGVGNDAAGEAGGVDGLLYVCDEIVDQIHPVIFGPKMKSGREQCGTTALHFRTMNGDQGPVHNRGVPREGVIGADFVKTTKKNQ